MTAKKLKHLEIVFGNGDVIKLDKTDIDLLNLENIKRGVHFREYTIHYLICEKATIKISWEALDKEVYYTIDDEPITNRERLHLGDIGYFELHYQDGSSEAVYAPENNLEWGWESE